MDRDIHLFYTLLEYKIMSFHQIRKFIFSNTRQQVTYRRLLKFLLGGYIERIFLPHGDRYMSAYSLSENGLKKLVEVKGVQMARYQLRSNSIDHDLALVEIGERLKNAGGVVKYLTENILRSTIDYDEAWRYRDFVQNCSDACLEIERDDRIIRIAVEYESTLKSNERYERKFMDYRLSNNIGIVFYICESINVWNRLEKLLLGIATHNNLFVYFALRQDLFSPSNEVIFKGPGSRIFQMIWPTEIAEKSNENKESTPVE